MRRIIAIDAKVLFLNMAAGHADEVFDGLDLDLAPIICLAEIREECDGRLAVENCPDGQGISNFQLLQAIELARKQEAGNVVSSAGLEHQITGEAITRAIVALGENSGQPIATAIFCSDLCPIEGTYYCILIQLNKICFDKHNGSDTKGFLRYVINEYLEDCVERTRATTAWSAYKISQSSQETTRRAAGQLLLDIQRDALREFGNFQFFHHINAISALRYEGQEALGSILLIRATEPPTPEHLSLTIRVGIEDAVAIRKLLQLSSVEHPLLCNGRVTWGVGSARNISEEQLKQIHLLKFEPRNTWSLYKGRTQILRVQNGIPILPSPPFDAEQFAHCVQIAFGDIKNNIEGRLTALAYSISKLKHGALLVIVADPHSEVKRLQNQCIPIRPMELQEEHIESASLLDGAIMLDTRGVCHAIGVILDGSPSVNCLTSRGARYNSAVRYVDSHRGRMAIVKSEDGLIDVIPTIHPRISRQLLLYYINKLERSVQQSNISAPAVIATLSRMRRHAFYLSQSQCDTVNAIRRVANERLPKHEALHDDNWPDFVPDSRMSSAFYVD